MGSPALMFTKPVMLYAFLAVLLLVVVGLFVFKWWPKSDKKEGFYPVTDERITLGRIAMHRYNDFADTQDMEKVNVIPEGPAGEPILNALLDTPSYSSDGTAKGLGRGPANSLNYYDERTNIAAPDIPILLKRIKMCEAVQAWDCEALSRPEFKKYCGICTSKGQDHLGKPHLGGLYTDPDAREKDDQAAARLGRKAVYTPNFGRCDGEFITERPFCDTQKDRDDCKKATDINNPDTASKCALCSSAAGNTFVYIGKRGGQDTGFKLFGAPIASKVRLRLGVTHPNTVKIVFTHVRSGTIIPGGFIPNTNVYLIDIMAGYENDDYKLSLRYPEYKDYAFSEDQVKAIQTSSKPPRAALVRASYGPNIEDYKNDDPRAIDVSAYIKDKFKILDCSKSAVMASNDGLGGDPNPGIYKQLRLAYSNNGTDFAYAYGKEGQITQPVLDGGFQSLCPPDIPIEDLEKQTCEMNAGGIEPTGRIYTKRPLDYFGASGKSKCVMEEDRLNRGFVGVWESTGMGPRTVPLSLSITQINGFDIDPKMGPPAYGTVKGSEFFKGLAPASKMPGIPPFLFWIWTRQITDFKCEATCKFPAVLRDPTIQEDMRLCPVGPLTSTREGATRLQAGACDKLINGLPQGPGTYTDDCVRSLFIQGGCTKMGKGYPQTPDQVATLSKDPDSGVDRDADAIIQTVSELRTIASTGANSAGLDVEQQTYIDANMQCMGATITNVCDTPFKETGPHTPACLDYLFRNAGADNPSIGATYPNQQTRSSGTNRVRTAPIMYCQRTGSKAPVNKDGQQNVAAMQEANSKGSVAKVREFYRQIHYNANFNMDRNEQKEALDQCYGAKVLEAPKECPPPPVKPVSVCPSSTLPITITPRQGNKIGKVKCPDGDYELKFDITPKSTVGDWGSILHFSGADNNCCNLGDRSPAIWFQPSSTNLHIRIGDANDGNWGWDSPPLPMGQKTKFNLTCKGSDITITIGNTVQKLQQPSRRYKGDLNVWSGDPWYQAANALIDNLSYCPVGLAATGATMPGAALLLPGISIKSATYGGNCNGGLKDNRLKFFQDLCNGKSDCTYTYNYTAGELPEPKDPAGGCGKTLEITYDCPTESNKKFVAPPEAGYAAQVKLSCPAKGGGNAPCAVIYQHCTSDPGGRGAEKELCVGNYDMNSPAKDRLADASFIKVPAGLKATIWTGNFTGRSRTIGPNSEFNFCSDGGWANDAIRSIRIENA
jgi:hypothetical protein